jgi:hypothetical protein
MTGDAEEIARKIAKKRKANLAKGNRETASQGEEIGGRRERESEGASREVRFWDRSSLLDGLQHRRPLHLPPRPHLHCQD